MDENPANWIGTRTLPSPWIIYSLIVGVIITGIVVIVQV